MTIGIVSGVNVDYTSGMESAINCVSIDDITDIDIIVGTSMGGWMACSIGGSYGIPFVSLNPCFNPSTMLKKSVGENLVDHVGNTYSMNEDDVSTWVDMLDEPSIRKAFGTVILEEGDEVIDSHASKKYLEKGFPVVMLKGGSHRFEKIKEALYYIEKTNISALSSYGRDIN